MKRAIFTGSFDPIHLGHIDIIRRAAAICDELTVAVTVNLSKHSMYTFDQRVKMVLDACGDLPNLKVTSINGLRAKYVNEHGFDVEVKSLRNTADLNYELPLAQMHAKLYNDTETIFLMTDPKYSFISSSSVREVFKLGGDVSFMVHPKTLEYMNELKLEEK